jgi:hypothetical protein
VRTPLAPRWSNLGGLATGHPLPYPWFQGPKSQTVCLGEDAPGASG